MEKYCRVGKATDIMEYANCMLDTQGYKYTLRLYKTYCFSTVTMVARNSLNITLYVHCLPFSGFRSGVNENTTSRYWVNVIRPFDVTCFLIFRDLKTQEDLSTLEEKFGMNYSYLRVVDMKENGT